MTYRRTTIQLTALATRCLLRVIALLPAAVISASLSREAPKTVASAPRVAAIADGRSWNVNMVEDARKLLPDGTGNLDDAIMKVRSTWRPRTDGLCIRPSMQQSSGTLLPDAALDVNWICR